jgi:hypothetical protein
MGHAAWAASRVWAAGAGERCAWLGRLVWAEPGKRAFFFSSRNSMLVFKLIPELNFGEL